MRSDKVKYTGETSRRLEQWQKSVKIYVLKQNKCENKINMIPGQLYAVGELFSERGHVFWPYEKGKYYVGENKNMILNK